MVRSQDKGIIDVHFVFSWGSSVGRVSSQPPTTTWWGAVKAQKLVNLVDNKYLKLQILTWVYLNGGKEQKQVKQKHERDSGDCQGGHRKDWLGGYARRYWWGGHGVHGQVEWGVAAQGYGEENSGAARGEWWGGERLERRLQEGVKKCNQWIL